MIQRHGQVKMVAERVKRTFVRKAIPEGPSDPYILQQHSQLYIQMNILIFSNTHLTSLVPCEISSLLIRWARFRELFQTGDTLHYKVTYSYSKKREVLELLEEHITENIVKVLMCSVTKHTIVDNQLDRMWLLPPGSWDSPGFYPFILVMFILLWWSGETIWTLQRGPPKRIYHPHPR